MGTVRFSSHTAYLVVRTDGEMRVRKRRPHSGDLGLNEYAFEITVRVPQVQRATIAGRLDIELPPGVDPDAEPLADVAGPIDLCRAEDVAT
jgi:hypothetical protein